MLQDTSHSVTPMTHLKLVFEDVLKIVNFIKSRDVNLRISKELCKEMGEEYQVLLYHTDVRWLSRGKVVHRVIELRKAIQEFLEQKGSPFATKFTDKEWLARLCYLADIFAELNSGNLQLQGRNTTVIDARHTVAAFLAKLRLWIRRLEKGVIAQFPTLDQFIEENSHDTGSLLQTINKEMSDHLKGLETSMHHYFLESDQETASLQWIIHPFSVPDEAIHDDDFPAKEEWITMRANEALKIEFQN
ncbi:protein FAM200C-like [Palaemon carinicauda]|uniref:protein FAM200C-like n=1 Tax=Palaemon carinicauda TaxID=392227 RepID=UPI0035B5DE0C